MLVIKLHAPSDGNGNPHRVFVGFNSDGEIGGAWDEGYAGAGAMPKHWRPYYHGATFLTTPGGYHDVLRLYGPRAMEARLTHQECGCPIGTTKHTCSLMAPAAHISFDIEEEGS